MKTLNDLVDKLNNYVEVEDGKLGKYYIEQGGDKRYYLYEQYYAPDDGLLVVFAPDYPHWIINWDLGGVNHIDQEKIMDFIYTTDSNHWFDGQEKKYNIIISKNPSLKVAVAYFKPNNDTSLKINESATQDDLKDGSYQFTDDEIEKLKKAGNSTFNQFVDLGKVEVTNED